MSVRRQCELAGISRKYYYYTPRPENEENLKLMRLIDEQYLKHPEFGYPRMTDYLRKQGYQVNEKRVARLMGKMGIQAITPGPHTSKPHPEHKIYPYLLRGLDITRSSQVWSMDITYIPMKKGYLYLVAIIDWYSRYIVGWELSNTLDNDFCVRSLRDSFERYCKPEIVNTDQGSQFTSKDFIDLLQNRAISISMDGKGRAIDNIMIERFWWTLKYEEIYPKFYDCGKRLTKGLEEYIQYYNNEREHSSLGKKCPREVFIN